MRDRMRDCRRRPLAVVVADMQQHGLLNVDGEFAEFPQPPGSQFCQGPHSLRCMHYHRRTNAQGKVTVDFVKKQLDLKSTLVATPPWVFFLLRSPSMQIDLRKYSVSNWH
jgi:hypothetical protein